MSPSDSSEIEIGGIGLPRYDWETTPASIQALVATFVHSLAQQEEQLRVLAEQFVGVSERVSHLEEQVRQTSQKSSRAPSSEGFGKADRPRQKRGKGRRGGQVGHAGKSRDLYPIEACSEVIDHVPASCRVCGVPLGTC